MTVAATRPRASITTVPGTRRRQRWRQRAIDRLVSVEDARVRHRVLLGHRLAARGRVLDVDPEELHRRGVRSLGQPAQHRQLGPAGRAPRPPCVDQGDLPCVRRRVVGATAEQWPRQSRRGHSVVGSDRLDLADRVDGGAAPAARGGQQRRDHTDRDDADQPYADQDWHPRLGSDPDRDQRSPLRLWRADPISRSTRAG